jgi:hypothetical protein
MWIDIAAAIATTALAAVGFRRGALAAFLQVLILGASYAAAFFVGPLLAPRVAESLGSGELVGLAVAGVGVGAVAYALLAGAAFLMIRRRDGRKRYGRSLSDRLGGAAIGIAQGALVALLLGVLASWLEAGRSVGQLENIPQVGPTQVSRFSRAVIETAAAPAIRTGDAPARVAMHLAARPGETLRAGQQLLDRPEILALRNDPEFWAAVDAGDIERAMQSKAFLAISGSRLLGKMV